MIRKAKLTDIRRLLRIYEGARAFMRRNGNMTQWNGSYPDEQTLTADVANGTLYVAEDSGHIYGCFALIGGEDPTYGYIDGNWLSDAPYGTLHRVASDGTKRRVFAECVKFAEKKYDHLRVDTHEDNKPMQQAILREGFSFVGIIYLADGAPRRAYERIK
ncbi:MAG: N-acetyltransferase [Ruminococcaceae bacterium]|nr:N-acetyltransferase [Oscillospiraceae bacterium]